MGAYFSAVYENQGALPFALIALPFLVLALKQFGGEDSRIFVFAVIGAFLFFGMFQLRPMFIMMMEGGGVYSTGRGSVGRPSGVGATHPDARIPIGILLPASLGLSAIFGLGARGAPVVLVGLGLWFLLWLFGGAWGAGEDLGPTLEAARQAVRLWFLGLWDGGS